MAVAVMLLMIFPLTSLVAGVILSLFVVRHPFVSWVLPGVVWVLWMVILFIWGMPVSGPLVVYGALYTLLAYVGAFPGLYLRGWFPKKPGGKKRKK